MILLGAMAAKKIFLNYEWPIGLFELRCFCNETNIWDCTYNITNGGQYCYQHNDASVFCMRTFIFKKSLTKFSFIANTTMYSNCSNGDIRLVGGSTDNEGNVQICYDNAWGSICDHYWGMTDSDVVCRQLGYQLYGKYTLYKIYPFNFNQGLVTIIVITLEFPTILHIYMEHFPVLDLKSQ